MRHLAMKCQEGEGQIKGNSGAGKEGKKGVLAERVGFEPTVQSPVLRFSRPALSSTQPSLHNTHSMTFHFLCQ